MVDGRRRLLRLRNFDPARGLIPSSVKRTKACIGNEQRNYMVQTANEHAEATPEPRTSLMNPLPQSRLRPDHH